MTSDPAPLRLVRSERMEGGPSFFTVENRWYVDGDGREHLRSIVLHRGAVAVVPFDGSRVWMIRQQRVAVGARLLELPAGILDVQDEGPEEAARRECAEEIGLVPGRLSLLHRFYNSPGFTDEETLIYLGEDLVRGTRRPVGAEELEAEVVGVDLADVERLLDRDEIQDGKTLIGLQAVLLRVAGR